ncbi:cadherin EGF LAG seven-pass G-type receptor 2 [Euwallacea fornicatus]|uniref:cadherin EGF LAG seven-pass G-type receptor 2 n=1 Tax=Euwallacea fornicatus TaxID=995702 RepID=UPI00338FACEE
MAHWQEAPDLRLFLIIFLPIAVRALQDSRCYLENGASSETLFVIEDLPVGETIGRIRVVGDPRPGIGTIALQLKESDSPVDIAPGSKNLTLSRPLDKEGIEGPSSVFVTLVCDRLGTLEPGFEIPINIRVTDANDNAPLFINAPYVLNISEVTVVGTRVLQGVHAIDNDQQGPFSSVRYSVLPGPNSDFFEFENELEGTLVLKKPLDYETLRSFDVNIRAQDHGDPPKSADTVLTVHVMDADDQNPRFLDDRYLSVITDPAIKDLVLKIKPRDIRAVDQDEGIGAPVYYTFNGIGSEYSMFKLDRHSGRVSLSRNLEEMDLQSPVILVIKATQRDNPDRQALATLTVTRSANKSIRFHNSVFNFRASEDLKPGSVVGTLANNRPGHHLKYFVSDPTILKIFAINTLGELSLKGKLDYEVKPEYIFKICASDEKTNDTSVVNITVENVNEWEPRFRYPHYEFFPGRLGTQHDLIGRVEAADGDRNDPLTLTLSGPNASSFFITPTGELRLRDMKDLGGSEAKLTVTATDSGDPPKRNSVPVTVHFPDAANNGTAAARGSNSGPILLAGLGAILFLLSLVVAVLVAYICKVRRNSDAEAGGVSDDKSQPKSAVNNPVFGSDKSRSATAVALGGIPSNKRIPSPKIHPAPQPPMGVLWPSAASRVKKLSWGDDKTDSESTENLNQLDQIPKVLETSNLTVYF